MLFALLACCTPKWRTAAKTSAFPEYLFIPIAIWLASLTSFRFGGVTPLFICKTLRIDILLYGVSRNPIAYTPISSSSDLIDPSHTRLPIAAPGAVFDIDIPCEGLRSDLLCRQTVHRQFCYFSGRLRQGCIYRQRIYRNSVLYLFNFTGLFFSKLSILTEWTYRPCFVQ